MFIEFGILSYKLLIPLIYPILYQLREVQFLKKTKPNVFYKLFIIFLSHLLGGIVYRIIKCRMKEEKNPENQEKETYNYKYNINNEQKDINNNEKASRVPSVYTMNYIVRKQNEKMTNTQLIRTFLLAILFILPIVFQTLTYKYIDRNLNSGFYLFSIIFFFVLLSKFILGHENYSHQKFSLGVIAGCLPIVILIHFLENSFKPSVVVITYLIITGITFLYAFYNVMIKRYFIIYSDSPYKLTYNIGLINISFLITFELIALACSKGDFNGLYFQIKTFIIDKGSEYILIFIMDLLTSFFWIMGIQLTLYFFTPCHFIISESISKMFSVLEEKENQRYSDDSKSIGSYSPGSIAIICIIYVIIIVSGLIYNEIIIINVGSLSVNTRKKILGRENKEQTIQLKTVLSNVSEEDMDTPCQL